MRLPLIAPADLTEEQKPLYADMKKGIGSDFNAFITIAPEGTTEAGALMGPWNPWLHEPRIGGAIWELTKAMTMEATLPDRVRQVAILVTGAHFDAAYEIYAHIAVAEKDEMDDATLATLVSGSRPAGLSAEEGIGYDVAYALVNGGVLPQPVYALAVSTFGQHGTNELIYLVGLYALVSMTLNGFNVPLPEKD
ncbi:carboxymuconolactone decarboxylase family protein [Sphingomonas sp. CGMCC 1.13654]|uniref:Carboxymuconolactone decarboxylase family protein n=1 Tax=Sphingomonas chungangi TaxID=2683589 RepID=A0A838L4N8_9SPHN|nr:carboxymuconolactone decarboxylase family protein [Sphingomonas chungangi]MBA2934124.1 carboxymuconolactone decarboxylase family protein [Sphingomonas chungangi]MVW57165.1 carboxymuconolactone decarboxylase family protein [Sphingomonas chungangi]